MNFDDLPHWALKLIVIIVLFLLSVIFGVVPLWLSRDRAVEHGTTHLRNTIISLSNCFAGGVFFSTVILDLLPMVKEKMNDALTSIDFETEFPLGEFVVGFGFIFMLVMEQFVHTCFKNSSLQINHGHSHEGDDSHLHDDDHRHGNKFERQPLINNEDDDDDPLTEVEIVVKSNQQRRVLRLGPAEVLQGNSISNLTSEDEHQTHNTTEEEQNENLATKSLMSYETFYSANGTYHRISRMKRAKSLASMKSVSNTNFRAYILVFAISLHSLLEGLSVGLLTKTQVLLQVFVALVIHKSIIAFSIGVQLVDADMRSKSVVICIAIFAVMAPLGIGLGILVVNAVNSGIKVWASGLLQGLATGSFLYVTFFEVLPHELNIADDKKPLKILFVLIGYLAITGICYYENRFHRLHHVTPAHSTVAPPDESYAKFLW